MDTVVVGPRSGETKILKDDGSGFTKEFFRQISSGRPIEQVVIEQNASLRSGEQELAEVQRAIYMEKKEGVLQEKIPKGFGHPILHSKKSKSREDGMKKNCKPLKKKLKQLESMVGKTSQMEQKLAKTNSRIDAIQKRLRGVGKGAVKEQEKALETVLANAEKRIRS